MTTPANPARVIEERMSEIILDINSVLSSVPDVNSERVLTLRGSLIIARDYAIKARDEAKRIAAVLPKGGQPWLI